MLRLMLYRFPRVNFVSKDFDFFENFLFKYIKLPNFVLCICKIIIMVQGNDIKSPGSCL